MSVSDTSFDAPAFDLFSDNTDSEGNEILVQEDLVATAELHQQKIGLDFVFGTRLVQWLAPDGDTIATQLWRSGLLAAWQLHQGSFLDVHATTRSPILDVAGLDVLEIGCGCGLAGVIAGLHGAHSVTLADCDDRALIRLGLHLEHVGGHDEGERMSESCRRANLGRYGADFENCYLFPPAEADLPPGTELFLKDVGLDVVPRSFVFPQACHEFHLRHQLWEQDEADNAEDERVSERIGANIFKGPPEEGEGNPPPRGRIGVTTTEDFAPSAQEPPQLLRHWSDIYRSEGHRFTQILDKREKFDVVIAADCLYFPSQEAPLVAVLKRRLRCSPKSVAMVIVQTRSNGGFQVLRFVALLQREGFCVDQGARTDWNYALISQSHVYQRQNGHSVLPQSKTESLDHSPHGDETMHATGSEVAEHVLFIRRQE